MVLVNNGCTPTFEGLSTSIIDVTYSKNLQIHNWKVRDDEYLSDHAYVTFSTGLLPVPDPSGHPQAAPLRGWSLKRVNLMALEDYVRNRLGTEGTTRRTVQETAEVFDAYMTSACNASEFARSSLKKV